MTIQPLFKTRNILRIVFLAALACVLPLPVEALSIPVFGPYARLGWTASPDPNVVGYNVYYGGQSGVLSSHLRLGNVTNVTINGVAGSVVYFVVKARDSAGNESVPSNEVFCTMSNSPSPPPTVATVASVPLQISRNSSGINICAADTIVSSWILESSADLRHWQQVISGTNVMVDVTVPAGSSPHLFYRLRGP